MPVAGKALSVRLDAEAMDALEAIVAGGLTRSQAIRLALVETAGRRRRRPDDVAAEARRLAEDPEDRAEVAELLEFMEDLDDGPW